MASRRPDASRLQDRVRAAVAAQERLLIETASALVRVPSANPSDGEERVAEYVSDWIAANTSMSCSILAMEPGRANVVARLESGRPGKTLMLSGHLDTKEVGDERLWSWSPLSGEVEDGRLRGRGAADMKASVAAMLVAAKALERTDGWAGTLLLVLTADEEAGGRLGARFLSESGALDADAGIVGEPAGVLAPYEFIALACRGGCWVEIRIEGYGGHSSIADRLGLVNPNHRIGQVLGDAFARFRVRQRAPHPLYPDGVLYNLAARVSGGDGPGTVPHETVILGDVRIPPGITQDEVQAAVDAYQAGAPDGVTMRLVKYSSGVETPTTDPVAVSASFATRSVLGRHVPFLGYPAGTDATHFISVAGIPCVTALGPGVLAQAHVPDESVDLESVVAASHVYALAAIDYLSHDGA